MTNLPSHGQVACTRCFESNQSIEFDRTRRTDGAWRITSNPMAWGSSRPEIIVLGFSKGPTQAGALSLAHHDEIAYKGSRGNVGKILQRVGLLDMRLDETPTQAVNRLIIDKEGRFHFGSLIRCTVERNDGGVWKGSGGGMLDRFVATPFGQEITGNCVSKFLGKLPGSTRLIVMFGTGSKLKYVHESFRQFEKARGGSWRMLNDVAYTDGSITVVHVEHFASQGALIPQWLGERDHPRARFGVLAQEAVRYGLQAI